jgi:hypothetical protein
MPSTKGIQKRSRTKQPQRAFLPRHSKRQTLQPLGVPCRVPYLYAPLPKGHIRLLTIKSSKRKPPSYHLATYKQWRAPKYDAVSYCWGEDLTSTVINCDGADLRIRKSLSTALPYLANRPKSARPLWIDAICLNQEDNEEKAIHVPLMHKIYKCAARTIVWLGEPDEGTNIALDFLAEAMSHLESGGDPQDLNRFDWLGREWTALREYLQRPWFNRLWTLQEVVLSKTIEILCSTKKTRVLTWRTLEKFVTSINDHNLSIGLMDTCDPTFNATSSIYSNLLISHAVRCHMQQYGYVPVFFLLELIRIRSSHEPVDKIWALLGLLSRPLVNEIQRKNIIDYSHAGKHEYWTSYLAFMKVLHTKDIYEFCKIIRLTIDYPRHALLPSWGPDFNASGPNSDNFPWAGNGKFKAGLAKHKMHKGPEGFIAALYPKINNALSIAGFCVDEVKGVTCVYPENRNDGLSQESRMQFEKRWVEWREELKKLTREILGESEEAFEVLGEVLLAADYEAKDKYSNSGSFAHGCRCLLAREHRDRNANYVRMTNQECT